MIKSLRSFITKFAVGLLLVAPLAAPAVVYGAASNTGVDCGSNLSISGTECTVEDTGTNLDGIVKFAINLFSIIVGIIAVVMIIVGGLKYITSGGDSGDITSAKNTILYAVVGLVVVALAQFIVHFVLSKSNQAVTGGGASPFTP